MIERLQVPPRILFPVWYLFEDNKSYGTLSKGKTDENIYRVTEFTLWKIRTTNRGACNKLGMFWVSTDIWTKTGFSSSTAHIPLSFVSEFLAKIKWLFLRASLLNIQSAVWIIYFSKTQDGLIENDI